MLPNKLRSSNRAGPARALAFAVIYMVAAGCDGPAEPAGTPVADGKLSPKAVKPRIGGTFANIAPLPSLADADPEADEHLLLDQGPVAGVYAGCWSNTTEGENYADSFSFADGATITEVQVFACIPEAGQADRTVHLKLLAGGGPFPGERLYEVDTIPVVQFTGSNTSAYMVSVRLPEPFVAAPGQTYWVGISGNGFEMSQTSIFKPGDGMMALYDGRRLLGLTAVGDMTFRLVGTAVRSNVSPTAELKVTTGDPTEGSSVDFTLDAVDADGDSIYYAATFGDGTGKTGVVTASPMTISHVYSDNGASGSAYRATVTVNDGRGGSSSTTATVSVANAAPTVDPIPDAKTNVGGAYALRATFADAGVLDAPWSYSVDWGDGEASAGDTDSSSVMRATHTYGARGEYSVTVKITDKDGGSGVASAKVTVGNRPPVVSLAGAETGEEGSLVGFTATASDPDGDSLSYAWDFDGDRATDAATRDGTGTYRFPDNGTYFARVVVDDGHGGVDTATHRIVVSNVAPSGVLSASESVNEGSAIVLTLSNLTDPSSVDETAGLLAAFSCDGESYGPFAPARTSTCAAGDDAIRTVGGRVRDKDEGTSAYTRTVRVTNVAPSVDAGADQVVVSGGTISLAGRFTDPGAADAPWGWSWSSGQSGSAPVQGELPGASYRACSAATLTLSVRDKDGGVGSDAMAVAVTPLQIAIDVRSDAISFQSGAGIVAVYVFSTATFEATTMDPATVRLTGSTGVGTAVDRRTDGTWNWVADRDLNGDGRTDAIFRFRRDDLMRNGDLTVVETQLTLTGVAGGCVHVRGTDVVTVR